MEQYQLLRRLLASSIQNAFSYAAPIHLFVRLKGSRGGTTIINIDLTGKNFSIKRGKGKFIFLINGTQCYVYKRLRYAYDLHTSWTAAYRRLTHKGTMFFAAAGFPNDRDEYSSPNDTRLLEPYETVLRTCNGEHLVEITFPGKIPVTFSKERTKDTAYLHEWIIKKKI